MEYKPTKPDEERLITNEDFSEKDEQEFSEFLKRNVSVTFNKWKNHSKQRPKVENSASKEKKDKSSSTEISGTPSIKEEKGEDNESVIQNKDISKDQISEAQEPQSKESKEDFKNALKKLKSAKIKEDDEDLNKKITKRYMDMPKALHIMGYSNTRNGEGEDPSVGLKSALIKKMKEIENRQRRATKVIGYYYSETKARNDLCTLHEAYQFLSFKFSMMKVLMESQENESQRFKESLDKTREDLSTQRKKRKNRRPKSSPAVTRPKSRTKSANRGKPPI